MFYYYFPSLKKLQDGLTSNLFGLAQHTRYDPSYQPFTSDKTGHYAFDQQPAATLATVRVLAENIVHALPAKEQGGCAEHLKKITAA